MSHTFTQFHGIVVSGWIVILKNLETEVPNPPSRRVDNLKSTCIPDPSMHHKKCNVICDVKFKYSPSQVLNILSITSEGINAIITTHWIEWKSCHNFITENPDKGFGKSPIHPVLDLEWSYLQKSYEPRLNMVGAWKRTPGSDSRLRFLSCTEE